MQISNNFHNFSLISESRVLGSGDPSPYSKDVMAVVDDPAIRLGFSLTRNRHLLRLRKFESHLSHDEVEAGGCRIASHILKLCRGLLIYVN